MHGPTAGRSLHAATPASAAALVDGIGDTRAAIVDVGVTVEVIVRLRFDPDRGTFARVASNDGEGKGEGEGKTENSR